MTDLKRRVEACTWGRPGWLPSFEVIEWPALTDWRERHEAAVAALAKPKAGPAEIEAVCRVVEEGTNDLRKRLGMSYTPGSSIDRPDEFRDAYAMVRAELESEPELRALPTGHASIDEAEAKGLPSRLADLARRRERLAEDLQRFTDLRLKIDGPTRLVDAEILTLPVSETRVARAELSGQTTGAVAA